MLLSTVSYWIHIPTGSALAFAEGMGQRYRGSAIRFKSIEQFGALFAWSMTQSPWLNPPLKLAMQIATARRIIVQKCPKYPWHPAAGILQDGHGASFPLLKVGPGMLEDWQGDRFQLWSHVHGNSNFFVSKYHFPDGLESANSWLVSF